MKITNLFQEINESLQLNMTHGNLLVEANLQNLYNKTKDYDNWKASRTPEGKKFDGGYTVRGARLVNKVRYFGLSDDGTLNFKINSETNPGKFHYAYIQADDLDMLTKLYLDKVERGEHLQHKDLNDLLRTDVFRVGCNCQAFLYWAFKYIATMEGYEIEPETRKPTRNNTEQKGALCKHLVAVVKNMYENTQMRTQIMKDIENYLAYMNGLSDEEWQDEKAKRMVQQQKHQVKWRNKASDYDFANDYMARQAKMHPFLDDHDVKHSLKMEINKYIHKNPEGTVNDFLKDFFGMTIDGMADEMGLPVNSVEEYFDELGFTSKKEKQLRKVQKAQQDNKANILNNNRPEVEEPTEEIDNENIEEEI